MNNIPLSIMLENTRHMMFDSFSRIQEQSQLPAYLLEGIVVDLLSQVRNQKNLELVQDYNRMNQEKASEEEKKEGE